MNTNNRTTIHEQLYDSFGLRENPFRISPDPRFLFSGPAYQSTIADLQRGIESRSGLIVLTGEAGLGKSTLMRYLLQWLSERRLSSSYIFHAHLDPAGLLEFVLRDFGVEIASIQKSDLLATLHRWLTERAAHGDSPVVIVDEAQALPVRTLSELSLLLNVENARGKMLQIVLAGQPELEEKLHRPDLYSLRKRIAVRCRLPLLSLQETSEYIDARLRGAGATDTGIFPIDTVRSINSYARGIPRVVNLLCEHALQGAYAEGNTVVSSANVRRAAAQFELVGEPYTTVSIDLPLKPEIKAGVPRSTTQAAHEIPLVVEMPIKVQPAVPKAVTAVPEKKSIQIGTPVKAAPVVAVAAGAAAVASGSTAHTAALPSVPPRELRAERPKPVSAAPKSSLVEFRIDSDGQGETPKLMDGFAWRKNQLDTELRLYWREVSGNFKRDLRELSISIGPFMRDLPRTLSSLFRKVGRGLVDPLHKWLHAPISANRQNSNRSVHGSRVYKH